MVSATWNKDIDSRFFGSNQACSGLVRMSRISSSLGPVGKRWSCTISERREIKMQIQFYRRSFQMQNQTILM